MNDRPGTLDSAIVSASGQRIRGTIQWLSPLADDDYAEYRDDAFLEAKQDALAKLSMLSCQKIEQPIAKTPHWILEDS